MASRGETTDTVIVTDGTAGVRTVSLARPARRNALDLATMGALRAAIRSAPATVIVVRSAAPGMFCAGADLAIDDGERAQVSRELYALYGEMLAAPAVIVTALDGPAVGGGAQLAIASDLRIAGPDAWLQFVGPGHGLAVGAWALPSLVGRGRALDLCLSSTRVQAAQALAIGLVDRVESEPAPAAAELAARWAALDPDAVRRVKAIVGRATGRAEALALEASGNDDWDGGGP